MSWIINEEYVILLGFVYLSTSNPELIIHNNFRDKWTSHYIIIPNEHFVAYKKKVFGCYGHNEEVLDGYLTYFASNPINVNFLPIHNFWNAQNPRKSKKDAYCSTPTRIINYRNQSKKLLYIKLPGSASFPMDYYEILIKS